MRLNNAKNTEDRLILDSGPTIVGRSSAGGGSAEELTPAQIRSIIKSDGIDATGFLGIKTAIEVEALTGMVAGQWVIVSDEYYRRRWYTGSEWIPGNKYHLMVSRTSTDGTLGTSIGVTLADGVNRKLNIREYIPDLGIVKNIKLVANPSNNNAGNVYVNILFQCGRFGFYYNEVENSSSGNLVPFNNNQYYNTLYDLPLSLLSGVDNSYVIGVYINRDGGNASDTYAGDMIVSGIRFEYVPKPF